MAKRIDHLASLLEQRGLRRAYKDVLFYLTDKRRKRVKLTVKDVQGLEAMDSALTREGRLVRCTVMLPWQDRRKNAMATRSWILDPKDIGMMAYCTCRSDQQFGTVNDDRSVVILVTKDWATPDPE